MLDRETIVLIQNYCSYVGEGGVLERNLQFVESWYYHMG